MSGDKIELASTSMLQPSLCVWYHIEEYVHVSCKMYYGAWHIVQVCSKSHNIHNNNKIIAPLQWTEWIHTRPYGDSIVTAQDKGQHHMTKDSAKNELNLVVLRVCLSFIRKYRMVCDMCEPLCVVANYSPHIPNTPMSLIMRLYIFYCFD